MNVPAVEMCNEITFTEQRAGGHVVGIVALNNPRALNALTLAMFEALGHKLIEWRERADVACVVLHADSEKAFCAGGDVKALVAILHSNSSIQPAADFFSARIFRRLSDPCLSQADPMLGRRHYHGRRNRYYERRLLPRRHRAYNDGDAGDRHRSISRRRRNLLFESHARRRRPISRFDFSALQWRRCRRHRHGGPVHRCGEER